MATSSQIRACAGKTYYLRKFNAFMMNKWKLLNLLVLIRIKAIIHLAEEKGKEKKFRAGNTRRKKETRREKDKTRK